MKIATWNVNSVKARLSNVLGWLERTRPDVLLLQELKCETDAFPRQPFADLGYDGPVLGQKSYNGVALLSLRPVEDVLIGLPGDPDDPQARYVEGTVSGVRIASLYLPNGNPVESEKYPYKLRWMERLRTHAAGLLEQGIPVVLGGDYNVIPEPRDVYAPERWTEDALFRLETRRAFRSILHLGLTDALRACHPQQEHAYTFWDYQGGSWQRDHGLRIDHFLLSPQAADRLDDCRIDRGPRGEEKASDHTPVILTLKM